MRRLLKRVFLFFILVAVSEPSLADDKKTKQSGDDAFTTIMARKFDFGDTSINGEMKAPDDFFLRGKQSQSLSQMVRLRSGFKRELRNSRSGIKSVTR